MQIYKRGIIYFLKIFMIVFFLLFIKRIETKMAICELSYHAILAVGKRIKHPWYNALRRVHYHFCVILVKMHTFNISMKKHQTNPNQRILYEIPNQYYAKCQNHGQGKTEEVSKIAGS